MAEPKCLTESTPGLADRAIDALQAAAAVADGQPVDQGLPDARPEDFQAALAAHPHVVRTTLDRVILSDEPERGLDELLQNGALGALLPEVHAMVGFGDGEWRHKDVWRHTKQVVRQSVPRLELRWAALFHDIGKTKTRTITPDGKVHFLGHAEVGTRMFDKIDRRSGLFAAEPSLRSAIRFLILHHLRANQYSPDWTDSAVRRFARELGEHLDDVLCLGRADITTKRPEKKRRGLEQIEELQQRIGALAAEDARLPPLPSGIGDAIMVAFGLTPSRRIGDIKRALEDDVASGLVPAREDADVYIEYLRVNRERFGL
jgi:poly(A) polymerase